MTKATKTRTLIAYLVRKPGKKENVTANLLPGFPPWGMLDFMFRAHA